MALEVDQLPGLMEPVARELLGEPNPGASSKGELRYGSHGSLSVDLTKGTFYDHEAGQGGGVLDLITREKGLQGRDREEWIAERFPHVITHERLTNGRAHKASSLGKEVAHYDYVDETGSLLFQVVRYEPKTFRQRHRDGDRWAWGVQGIRQVPYRLTDLLEAVAQEHVVFIVEGEKDVDRLIAAGAPATCNAGGAGKWPEGLSQYFRDADVIVVADNDPQGRNPKTNELRFHPDGRPVFPGQDHARQVCAMLSEVARRVRYLDLKSVWPQCPLKGDVSDWFNAGHTIDRLYEIVERAPDWSPDLPGPDPEGRTLEPISVFRDPAIIPPRRWLYARHYIRGCVSTTVADGGLGKTILAIAEGIAIALGRNILGVAANEPVNVLYWNGEEPLDEIERRVHAVCQHFHLNAQDLTGRFHMMSGLANPITIATMAHGTVTFDDAVANAIEKAIVRLNIGCFMLDPFVSCHRVPESDNTNIDAVVKRFMAIAYRTTAAVELVHHTRKPHVNSNGDMSLADTRGASALVNAARSARVLNRMTEAQGRDAGVTDHRSYFRADNGKGNYAPAQMATWFKLYPEQLANGDNVAALESFSFPGAFDQVKDVHIDEVRARVGSSGQCKFDPRSPEWVGHIVADVVGLDADTDRKKIKEIVDLWIKNGQLFKNFRRDKQRRKMLHVDTCKTDADGRPEGSPNEPELFDKQ